MHNIHNREKGDNMDLLSQIEIDIEGGKIPVSLYQDKTGSVYVVDVDGVEWVRTANRTHGIVLYEMISEHITEYVNYKSL